MSSRSQKPDKTQTFVTHATIIMVIASLLVTVFPLMNDILPDGHTKRTYVANTNDSTTTFQLILEPDTATVHLSHHAPPSIRREVKIESSTLTFNLNPKLLLWLLVFSSMVATAGGLLLPLCIAIVKLDEDFKPGPGHHLFNLAVFGVLGLLTVYFGYGNKTHVMNTVVNIIEKFNILLSDTSYFGFLVMATSIIGCLGVWGMLLVASCVWKLNPGVDNAIKEFTALNDTLRFFLSAISILILFSVVNTSLMQQAIESVVTFKNYVLFPVDFVYSYGLTFTIILAIIYVPIHFHLQNKGLEIEAMLPNTKESEEKIKLVSKEASLKNLQVILSILAPALGGVFAEIVKHLG